MKITVLQEMDIYISEVSIASPTINEKPRAQSRSGIKSRHESLDYSDAPCKS